MNTVPYFIFLVCLLVLNISVLYIYFLSNDIKMNETVHSDYVPPALKMAYPVQALSLFAGIIVLFYFSDNKTWFFESRFLHFSGLLLLFGLFGFLEKRSKILSFFIFLLEWGAITGFVFLLPEFPLLTQTTLPAEAVRAMIGTGWFVIFKFFQILSGRFDGIVELQSLHIGFTSLLIFLLLPYTPVSLLQTGAMLFPVMLMLTPFYCVFHYLLPLNRCMQNFFCLFLTGLAFFTVPAGHWGTGVLMTGYVIFELAVVILHFLFNRISKIKKPLFFYENLLKKNPLKEETVRVVIYYNFLSAGLTFFMIYINLQFQVVVLAAFFYFRMYMNIFNPKNIKTGVFDLFREAKKTAKDGITESSQALSDLKKSYQSIKGKPTDEQS